jgi:hypothetical protein
MPEVETVNVAILILPLCFWLMAGFFCASARAQVFPVRSYSGQFTARQIQKTALSPASAKPRLTPVAGSWAYLLSSSAGPASSSKDELTLEPSLLVSQCERLKGLLLAELGQSDQWQGRIDLTIDTSLAGGNGPQLTAVHRPQGWTYELLLPKRLEQEILLRSLFQTLLLEIANRHAGVQSAELPLWLVEGMSAHLQANSLQAVMLQPGQYLSTNVIWHKGSQMMPKELRQRPALDFQQLSWPQESDLTAEGLPLYRSCAQLFVEELLRFDDGRACLRSMIGQLAQCWNWQTAFLQGFHSHFDQLLDVEKWWGVSYVDFARGYKAQGWSAADCRKRLQSSLDVPVEVHFDPNHMPVEANITLQEVIRQWPRTDAFVALQRAIGGLKFLEPRATPEVRPMTQLYLKTLLTYLKDSQAAEREPMLGNHAPAFLSVAKAEAIKQLNALDLQREALWASSVSSNLPQLSVFESPAAKSAAGH